ncbi:hypothetical protein AB6849_02365 [Serratia proteamaculans]|uniref:hypothetical protein n=1 Tax=Serratia TaxID=613 RepID=UPI001C574EFF|nr:hypothetical protein [Serratia proteamaculans]WEO89574.1 hypothetical protein JET59_026205 [Serratia proteamaculans]
MSTQATVIEIGGYRWPRHIAIHEAGHAIAAWFFGEQYVEIALADNDRVAKTDIAGDVDECKAVAVWNISYPRCVDEIKPYDLSTDEARRCLIEQVSRAMVTSLTGIVAQSHYTGENVSVLMETAGKADMQTVRSLTEVYQAAGGDNEHIQHKSLSRAQALIALKWWDTVALAKILENRNHMPASNFQRIMGDIDRHLPKPLTLAELDELAGGE